MHNNPPDIASICSNPNAMVALVHSARPFWIPADRQTVEGFSESQQPLTLPAANSHIRDIMDALAGLSSNEQNPSIACALAIDYEGKVTEIVLASSNEVTHRTQKHITRVWKDMVKISAIARYSRRHGVGDTWQKKESTALIRSIYEFCMPIFSKNFLDNLSRLRAWVSEYEKWNQEQESRETPLWPQRMDELRPLVTTIKEILQDLSNHEDEVMTSFTMTDHEALDMFTSTMDSVRDRATHLLAIGTGVRHFRNPWKPLAILGGIVNPYYCGWLHHILEDLISFPKNIERLRKFHLSRYFSRISDFELRIRPLNIAQCGGTPGAWPSNSLEWKEVYAYVHREKGYRFVGSEDAHDFSNIPIDPSELVVHPELKIAIYLHVMGSIFAQQRSNSTPPFNYISVSELPCRPCAVWISQLNSMDEGQRVEIRGSSYKWPHDWCMPAISAEEISEYIRDFAWNEYLAAHNCRGGVKFPPLVKQRKQGTRKSARLKAARKR